LKGNPSPDVQQLTNYELVTLAVYLLGGESKFVDTEDVAMKANELAPGRFTWKKYKDQVSFDSVRRRLLDARTDEKGGLLLGSERGGWQLSEAGLAFARTAEPMLKTLDLSRERLSKQEQKWRNQERSRILASDAWRQYQQGGESAVADEQIEAMFHVDSYVVGKARERKVVRLVNTFGEDPQIGEAVRELGKRLRMVDQ
jgi:hypothetical protein